jgi:outer membrane protein TolC
MLLLRAINDMKEMAQYSSINFNRRLAAYLLSLSLLLMPTSVLAQVNSSGSYGTGSGGSTVAPSGGSSAQTFSSGTANPFSGTSASSQSLQNLNNGSTNSSTPNASQNTTTMQNPGTATTPTSTSSPTAATSPTVGGITSPNGTTAPLSVPNTAPSIGGSLSSPTGTVTATPVYVPHMEQEVPPVVKSLPLETPEVVTLRASLQKKQILVLNLEDACRLVEGKSISINIAKNNQEAQKDDYLLRLTALLPDISSQVVDSKLNGVVQVFGGNTTNVIRRTYQPQITLNYTVYTGGRNIFDIQASKHRLEALKNQTEATRQDIMRQVALAYYDMQAAYWQRNLAQQSLKEAEQQVLVNQARFQKGVGLQVDALQAEGNRSLQRQNLVQADVAVSQASENLAQLLNLDFDVEILPDSLDAMMVQRIPETLDVPQLLVIAKKNNPNLQNLNELARAGTSARKTAIADLFPQINLTAYKNVTGPSPNSALPTTFTGLQASWNPLQNMGFSQPLIIRQATANLEVAKGNFALGQRVLQQSIVNAYVSTMGLKETVQASWDNLRATQAAYAQSSGRLQAGVGTNLELQLAQVNLATARSNLATAFFNYNRLQVTQLANLGVLTPQTVSHGYKLSVSSVGNHRSP